MIAGGLSLESRAFPPDAEVDSLDQIAMGLQRLRDKAGTVSYGEIAIRIAKRREAAGMNPAAARVARSSVHAMFSPGRRRMNPDLVAEIALALGENETAAAGWRDRCIEVQREFKRVDTSPVALPPPLSAGSLPQSFMTIKPPVQLFSPLLKALIILACIGLNYFGNTLNSKFELPLFLDMIGTATAAIALGPWYGALVGLTSNLLFSIGANPVSIAFALVNVVGALVWGYGVRAWHMRRPWWRFFLLNIAVALSCTLVAVPINVLIFGGVAEGHAAGDFVAVLVASGEGIWRAVFSVNISISVADKLLAGFIAIGIVHVLDRWQPAHTL